MWIDVDIALAEVPVNLIPLVDAATGKVIDEGVTYDEAGMDLIWHFETTGGVNTATAVTPTTSGVHDWAHTDGGMYTIEIPDTGGTVNNDTEGFGYFTGNTTANLPWRGPTIGFRAASLNNTLIDGDGIGTAISLDGGAATIAGMLTKMADDNGGADFDATTDSLEKIITQIIAGAPSAEIADDSTITTGTDTSGSITDTYTANDTGWQVAGAAAVNGFGINHEFGFTLGTEIKVNTLTVRAKENQAGAMQVWASGDNGASWYQISDGSNEISGNTYTTHEYTLVDSIHRRISDGRCVIRITSTATVTNKYLWTDAVQVNVVPSSSLTASEIAEAVVVHNVAEHTDHDSFGFRAALSMIAEYAITTSDTASSFTCSSLPGTANYYQGQHVRIHDVTSDRHADSWILSMDNAGVVILGRALPFTPDTLSELYVMGSVVMPAAVVDEWETQSQADPTGFHVNVMEKVGAKYKIADTTGNWATAGTWSDGVVPSAGDNIIIRNGVDVDIAANLDLGTFGTLEVQGNGTLDIDADKTVATVPRGWVISENRGTVTNNYGTITLNYEGTVTTNHYGGTITNNYYGTITNNYGTVRDNSGTVATNYYGIVVTNYSMVTSNNGVVEINSGTVATNNVNGIVFNAGGTIGTNNGTAREYQSGDSYPIVSHVTYGNSAILTQGNLAWITATGFNTTTPPTAIQNRQEMDSNSTQLNAIVTDTNDLQTNQGNWLTAVGFSTHTAANVWSVATRALTDKAGFSISGTITTLDALATQGDSNWATATGFSVPGDLMGLANDAITSAKFDESTAFPLKSIDTGATQVARTGADSDTLETLSDQIDAIMGSTGTGARTVAVTVNDGAAVLENAVVRFTEGANTYNGQTDASGEISFSLDDATYAVAISKVGYTFTPTTLVVDGNKTPTYSMTAVTISAPPNASTTTGVMTVYDEEGSVEAGVTITVQVIVGPGTAGIGYDSTEWAETSSALGVVEFAGIILGARYKIWRGTSKADVETFTAPTTGDSFDLAEVIGRS